MKLSLPVLAVDAPQSFAGGLVVDPRCKPHVIKRQSLGPEPLAIFGRLRQILPDRCEQHADQLAALAVFVKQLGYPAICAGVTIACQQ